MSERARSRIRVEGIVQGVGFRPFVHALATRYGLAGVVGNDAAGVFIEAEGPPGAVSALVEAVREHPPVLAVVERVSVTPVPPTGARGFQIVPSVPGMAGGASGVGGPGMAGMVGGPGMAGGVRQALVSSDTATCDDCLRELFDPADRRYRYPFVNCTNCGPRFTIVTAVPYDRENTTMAGFAMCEACVREYGDPADRRFHAQPVCCPECGPAVALHAADGSRFPGDPIHVAAALLASGAILAIKGLGGYHLAVDAANETAVAALRARKHREDKPFAVMAPDLPAVRRVCEVDDIAADLLTSPRGPIVLLPRLPFDPGAPPTAPKAGSASAPSDGNSMTPSVALVEVAGVPSMPAEVVAVGDPVAPSGAVVAPSVALGSRFLGVMLPYTPLHHLLARELGRPYVLTSGNVSDEPIAYRDDDAWRRLPLVADAFLCHDRPIHTRTDDSVVQIFQGAALPVRRSRGYAPEPIALPLEFPVPVLACGAELKSTFCLGKGRYAFLSPHIGDLENYETLRSFTTGIAQFRQLFDVEPGLVVHDLHPEYLSTKYALDLAERDGVGLLGVQHHHAHIASCLADNGEAGPVIGVAFDGTGYGPDGTIWGGELLVADLVGFDRAGHLEQVPMPGGATTIRQPWRMAAAYLHAAYGSLPPADLDVVRRNTSQWTAVSALLATSTPNTATNGTTGAPHLDNSAPRQEGSAPRQEGSAPRLERSGLVPVTSSAGRLFDAVSALVGIRDVVTYEGQAAIELEQQADRETADGYPVILSGTSPVVIRGTDLVLAVVDDLRRGVPTAVIAARFHHGLAQAIVAAVRRIADVTGLDVVALSGGVFGNLLLLEGVVGGLRRHGFRVLLHRRVPCNDGGISLGQATVAAALHHNLLARAEPLWQPGCLDCGNSVA